jgi:predicted ATPase
LPKHSRYRFAHFSRRILPTEVSTYQLDGPTLRRASPPKLGAKLRSDAANLPWVVENLKTEHPENFHEWIKHIQTALPDLVDIRTVLREDDRHRYLMLKYAGGVEVPSWNVSDGTLRLLALTIPAYLEKFEGILLIEEPENGLHPLAIETVLQSLRSVYDGQVLLATHSPLIVTQAAPEEVLCFNHDAENGTHIVSGDKHPRLSDWQGEVSLGTLFASGVLG